MAVNTTGITPAANFIREVWPDEAEDALQAKTVLADLVDTSFESKMKVGDILHIEGMSNPAVRVKSEDTSATWANITEGIQNVTINRVAYVGFLVEDIAEVQSHIAIRSGYTDKAMYSLRAYLEGDVTSGLASLPNGFSQLVGALGSDPTDDDWIRAVQYLDDADIPEDNRFIYCSPATYLSLLKQTKFTSSDFVGQEAAEKAIKKARVGMLYNAPVYKSTLANNNPASANTSYSWFCHKKGVLLIRQRKPTTHNQYIILEHGDGVMIDMIYQFAERLLPPITLGGGTWTDNANVGVRGA